MLLDGTDDYVNLGTVSARNFTTSDFSLLAWIYPTSVAAIKRIIQHGVSATSGYSLRFSATGELILGTSSPTETLTKSAASKILANKWQHVAATRKAGTVKLYIDGNDVTSVVGAHSNPSSSAADSAVGATVGGGADRFPGAIDEPAFFNVELTQQQIREYMRQSISASAPGVVSLHHFDDGLADFATTVAVAAVSGVNGTLTSGASWVYDRWAPWVEPRISSTGALAVSSGTATVVPGTLRNLIPRVACRPMIVSQWDFDLTTAGTGSILGEVQENGAAISGAVEIAEPAGAVLSRGQHVGVATREWSAETLYVLRMMGRLAAGGNGIRGSFNNPGTGYAIVAQPIDGTW